MALFTSQTRAPFNTWECQAQRLTKHGINLQKVSDTQIPHDVSTNAIIKDRYIKITEQEAKNTWPENYKDFWDNNYNAYIAG